MERIEINVQTGEQRVVSLTPEEIAAIQASQPTAAELMEQLRQRRNQLLAETDYLALADSTLTDEMRSYRQALRDLPANTVDPANPVWPVKPGGNS
jgi:hypothetical protein